MPKIIFDQLYIENYISPVIFDVRQEIIFENYICTCSKLYLMWGKKLYFKIIFDVFKVIFALLYCINYIFTCFRIIFVPRPDIIFNNYMFRITFQNYITSIQKLYLIHSKLYLARRIKLYSKFCFNIY